MTSTTTTLVSSLNPSTYGDLVTFTASVVSNDVLVPGPPTGTVNFYDGVTLLGFGIVDGSGNASLNDSNLTVAGSPHDITAVYSGDGTFDPSTSNDVFQVVNVAPTSLVVGSSTNWAPIIPGEAGTAVSFSALITASGSVTGDVTFKLGNDVIGVASISGNQATISIHYSDSPIPALTPVGPNSITAIYPGDGTFGGSSDTHSQDIGLQTHISFGYSLLPITIAGPPVMVQNQTVVEGTPVSLIAAVGVQSPISTFYWTIPGASGMMTFKEGGTVIGFIAVDAGSSKATLNTFFPLGTHIISAEYSGGGIFWPGTTESAIFMATVTVIPAQGGEGNPPVPPTPPDQPEVAPVPPQEFRRCPDKITCPGTDSPVLNLSSEAVDFPNFFSIYFGQFTPDLGTDFGTDGCVSVATSPDSLESANLQAAVDSLFCTTGTWTPPTFPPPPGPPIFPPPIIPPPPPPPLPDPVPPPPGYFGNTAQTATQTCINGQSVSFTVPADTFTAPTQSEADAIALDYAKAYCEVQALATCSDGIQPPPPPPPTPQIFLSGVVTADYVCPDGNAFSFTVQPGKFAALSQVLADRMAYSWALQQAFLHRICLSAIDPNVCLGTAATITIQATGGFLDAHFNDWEIVAGAVPPGMTFNGGFHGTSVTITGTPTIVGQYNFTVKVTAPNGDFMAKAYSLCVTEIQPASLPPATPNVAYLQDLTLNCGGTPSAWFLTSGTLPPGITLDNTNGTLSGTPTVAGSYTFVISVQLP